ncbi:pulcherriminic acid synthase [Streptomyces sp. 3213]|uniref:cytochrome P450 n=1 Tax=Streptomyces sp. 3213.3 TaxID=1855348 RepID=UPI00089BAAE9|nr:cytochrome P450 [Streptomyces sp. 3213.3]SEE67852.1 pulcherriminic acid synthase [Streptomyces sp. 3213] [Streptomyces sp. 3213.3]
MLCLTDVTVPRTAGAPARPPGPPSLRTAVQDPYRLYRTLRTHYPLVYDKPFGAWLLSRYDDVRAALADPRLVAVPGDGHPAAPEAGRLLERALRGPALAALTAAVERSAHVLARRLAAREDADLVAEFCDWLPTATAVAALGLPYEETARVHRWCRTGLGRSGGGSPELGAFLRPLTARRRAHPGGDLLSVLCTARSDGGPLSDDTVTGLVGTLLGAAGESTARALASFLANLLDHPRQLDVLRARPALTPGAWAESLRRDPPLHIVLRRAVAPVGPIPAGATVACLLGAAGRDPERFTDPDRYDAFRTDPGPLAHGTAPEALLARLTAEHGLRALLTALPGVRRAPGAPHVPDDLVRRSPRTLRVRT